MTIPQDSNQENETLGFPVYDDLPTEIVIGLVGPLGTNNKKIREMMVSQLSKYKYSTHTVHLSGDLIPSLSEIDLVEERSYDRSKLLIEQGNQLRKQTNNNAILAVAAAADISKRRKDKSRPQRGAFIVSSLKHPDEVALLRSIYGPGFYLMAISSSRDKRIEFLVKSGKGMPEDNARELISRDEHEDADFGQHTRDTFHLADFFIADEQNDDKLRYSIGRCFDLIFGKPTITPTFNEYAMFLAFTSSLRSADLSRQVGAVVTRNREILATGANDCPTSGGGLYWPEFVGDEIKDIPSGRDYMLGQDSNAVEKNKITNKIVETLSNLSTDDREHIKNALKTTGLRDITEYGRVVHAEMEALLACARSNVSCSGGTLYCTTFPCHNCAKHIIAAGIKEVVYTEPYPKSKALEFHPDAITTEKNNEDKVRFKPFIGVGPRKFFDLFSMSLGSGAEVVRKTKAGNVLPWIPKESLPRLRMEPITYMDHEAAACKYLDGIKEKSKESSNDEN